MIGSLRKQYSEVQLSKQRMALGIQTADCDEAPRSVMKELRVPSRFSRHGIKDMVLGWDRDTVLMTESQLINPEQKVRGTNRNTELVTKYLP